jgi:hypothetical protein
MAGKNCALSLLVTACLAWGAIAAEVRGVVIKADDTKKELTIEGRGKGARRLVLTFVIDQDTEILVDKQPGKVADLVAGKRVRVAFDLQSGQRIARVITLHGAGGAAPALLPAPKDANSLAGTLRRVAFTDREIVVIHAGAKGEAEVETTILVPDSAKITRDQKPIRFDDLKEGDQVVVPTEKKDGKLMARSVQVGAAAPANPRASDGRRIERIRQILKMIDEALQRIDQP